MKRINIRQTPMIDIWYLDISQCTESVFQEKLAVCPPSIQDEVMRYRFLNDRKLKLFARLLVQAYEQKNGRGFAWEDWKTSTKGKPYVDGAAHFNISHSGEIVAVAFSANHVGIDVEKHVALDAHTLEKFFHEEENRFIRDSDDKLMSLFTVWTRKEAYLKAIGIGLLNEMSTQNCLVNPVNNGTTWFIESEGFLDGYSLAVCSKESNEVKVTKILPTHF